MLSAPDRLAQRECGCPPWVLRCVHFEGQILVLGETGRHAPGGCYLKRTGEFGVWIGERFVAHNCGARGHLLLPVTSDWGMGFPYRSQSTANAEFDRRAEELRAHA